MPYLLIVLGLLGASLLVFAGASLTVRLSGRRLLALALPVAVLYVALCVIQPPSLLLSDAAVIVVAAVGGSAVGATVRSRASLVSLCLAAAIVDVISVWRGPTGAVIQAFRGGSSPLLQYLSFSIPLGERVIPVVGVGDLLILGAVAYALRRLGVWPGLSLALPLAGLLAALAVGLVTRGVPALPFLAAPVLLYLLGQELLGPGRARRDVGQDGSEPLSC